MKKLVLALILVLFVSNVCAELTKTRIFGYVEDINSNILLMPDYRANGIPYQQSITKKPDKIGNWEYILYSDPGKIKLTATLGGVSRDYEIPVGSEFKIDFMNDANSGVQGANRNLTQNNTNSQNQTASPAQNTSENQELINNTSDENETMITGKTISENIKEFFSKKFLIIMGIIIVFLVAIIFGIRVYNKRGLPSFKITPFKQKFSGEKEIEDAEEKLSQVQAEIDMIKNRERRIQEVSGKLKAAEEELEKLKIAGK